MMRILGYMFVLYLAVAAGADAPVLAGGVAAGLALWAVRALAASRARSRPAVAAVPSQPVPVAAPAPGVYNLASYRRQGEGS
jgi:hypothetical protein